MYLALVFHTLYTLTSVALTIWVARTLFRNGRIFLVQSFSSEEMGDSVNHLLHVGFYLVNIGFVCLFLRFGAKPETMVEAVEYLSTKLGIVLLTLGAMHFFNMFNIARIRSKSRHGSTRTPEAVTS